MSVLDYWNVRSLGGVGLCWRAVSCDLRVTVTAPPGEGGCVGGWCTEEERGNVDRSSIVVVVVVVRAVICAWQSSKQLALGKWRDNKNGSRSRMPGRVERASMQAKRPVVVLLRKARTLRQGWCRYIRRCTISKDCLDNMRLSDSWAASISNDRWAAFLLGHFHCLPYQAQ